MEMDLVEEFYFNRTALYSEMQNLIKQNSTVELEWIVNVIPVGNLFEEYSYYAMKEDPKNNPWINRYLEEFMPVYEKMSLYMDYYELRHKTIAEATLHVETLVNIFCKVGKELLLNTDERVKVIEALDPLELEQRDVSKDKLLYLATHTPTTWEIYDLLKVRMLNNPLLFPSTSDETTENLIRFFQNLEDLMDKVYFTDEMEMVPFNITDVLVLFYEDFRETIDAMKGRRMRIRQ
ncbi:hypothetical protein LG296_06805 [Ureibacillus chungkukjangi]|uniref:hypothetical protein n=1 Tax=Ureibacillus chungkukjangi TaxID=1202712 RepID=UPI00384CB69B